MGMYTPVRMVLDIVNVLTLNVLVPVLNYGPIVIILNVYSATRCSPPLFSSHYHCTRGGHAVARAVLLGAGRGRGHVRRHAPRLHGRHHGRAGAAHAQHQLDVQDGVVRVQLRAQLHAHEHHQPAAHEPAADATVLVEHDYTRTLRRAVAGHGPGRRSEAVRSALAARMCF